MQVRESHGLKKIDMYQLANYLWEQGPDQPKIAIPTDIFCRQAMTTTIQNQNRTTGTNTLLIDLHFLEPAEP